MYQYRPVDIHKLSSPYVDIDILESASPNNTAYLFCFSQRKSYRYEVIKTKY